MPHLRLFSSYFSSPLLSPLRPSLSFFLLSKPTPTPTLLSSFTVLSSSSSSRKHRNFTQYFSRRNNTSFKQSNTKQNKGLSMEDNESVAAGFNKRRAEGRDKSDKSKTLPLKVRKPNPANTICYVQAIAGPDLVYGALSKQRFIFNAGEGLQRFCTEHKIKLSKIDHIFLSRVCSENAGGLPGLLLTLAGIGDEGMSVNIWGPSDLKYLVDAMRSFIPKAAIVHTHCFGLAPSSDEVPHSQSWEV